MWTQADKAGHAPNEAPVEAGLDNVLGFGTVSVNEVEQKLLGVLRVPLNEELQVADIEQLCRLMNILPESNKDAESIQDASGSAFSSNCFCICSIIDSAIKSASSLTTSTAKVDDPARHIYNLLLESLPAGGKLTPKSLAALLAESAGGKTVSPATFEIGVDGSADAEKGDRAQAIVDRVPPSFLSQLGVLVSRCLSKFNVPRLLGQCVVALVAAAIVAGSNRGALDYKTLPLQSYGGMLMLTLVIAASSIYVFGDERLVFRREATTGVSVTAYWLAHTLVNIIDMSTITLVFSAIWYIIVAPDFKFADCFAAFLLLAWYVAGVSHFFSVSLDHGSALLASVLVPVMLISMFGGTGQQWSDMSNLGQMVARVGPGWYATENFVALEIIALPRYVRYNEEVRTMLHAYSYQLDHIVTNCMVLLFAGIIWRLLAYIVLLVDVKGVPGGFWCCTCFWCTSTFNSCTARKREPAP